GEVAMTRKMIDCRDFPSETGCTLMMSGTESELHQAAAEHAVSVHLHEDSLELRRQLLSVMKNEPSAPRCACLRACSRSSVAGHLVEDFADTFRDPVRDGTHNVLGRLGRLLERTLCLLLCAA